MEQTKIYTLEELSFSLGVETRSPGLPHSLHSGGIIHVKIVQKCRQFLQHGTYRRHVGRNLCVGDLGHFLINGMFRYTGIGTTNATQGCLQKWRRLLRTIFFLNRPRLNLDRNNSIEHNVPVAHHVVCIPFVHLVPLILDVLGMVPSSIVSAMSNGTLLVVVVIVAVAVVVVIALFGCGSKRGVDDFTGSRRKHGGERVVTAAHGTRSLDARKSTTIGPFLRPFFKELGVHHSKQHFQRGATRVGKVKELLDTPIVVSRQTRLVGFVRCGKGCLAVQKIFVQTHLVPGLSDHPK
mmetsp:Transcript_14805/g.34208  ORF Transcript_14805/g.34208 Transcript_14805/m.34208 type:complete len:294 (+) Transcript_14805:423-1304(+)